MLVRPLRLQQEFGFRGKVAKVIAKTIENESLQLMISVSARRLEGSTMAVAYLLKQYESNKKFSYLGTS